MSMQQTDLAGKRLELLREIVPGLRRLGVLFHAGNAGAVLDSDQVRAAAGMLGLELLTGGIQRAEEIAPTFEAFKGRAQALYIVGDALMSTNRIRINTLALAVRLPTMYPNRPSKREVWSPMDRTSRTCTDAPAITSTKSCAEGSRRKFRSSNRPNLIS